MFFLESWRARFMAKKIVKNAFKAFTKFTVILPMILIAAILSFTACNKDDGLNPLQTDNANTNDFPKTVKQLNDFFQSSDFIDALIEGRIASIEWREHTRFPESPDGIFRLELLEELSKPGEVWFELTGKSVAYDGYEGDTRFLNETGVNGRFKLERHPEISSALSMIQYHPAHHQYGLEWLEEENYPWVLAEKDGVVYKFLAPSKFVSPHYRLNDVFVKQSGTADRMFYIQDLYLDNDGSYEPTILSSVIEKAHSYALLHNWISQDWYRTSKFREPHQFKITRK